MTALAPSSATAPRDTPADVLFRLAVALLMSSLVLLLHRAAR